MGLRIVLVQFLVASPYFVAIPIEHGGEAMIDKSFAHDHADVAVEEQFANDTRQ